MSDPSDRDLKRTEARLRQRDPNAPSDLLLDQLHHGELDEETAADVRRRLELTHDGAERLAHREEGFAGFEDLDADRMFAAISERRQSAAREADAAAPVSEEPTDSWWSRLLEWLGTPPGFALAGMAAALLLALWIGRPGSESVPPGGSSTDGQPDIRVKGDLMLQVFRSQGSGAEELVSGAAVEAGDLVRFAVTLPEAGHILVVGVEANGDLYAAWPLDGRSKPHPQGDRRGLPGTVQLDDSAGREWLHLVQCETEFQLDDLTPRGDEGGLQIPAGCRASSFILEKE